MAPGPAMELGAMERHGLLTAHGGGEGRSGTWSHLVTLCHFRISLWILTDFLLPQDKVLSRSHRFLGFFSHKIILFPEGKPPSSTQRLAWCVFKTRDTRIARDHRRWGQGHGREAPSEAPEAANPADTLTLDFAPPEQ